MGLEEQYPKHHSDCAPMLCRLLTHAPHLDARAREDLALAMNEMTDKANDLLDIMHRLLEERHSPSEIGDLLIAFELTAEQLRGQSDMLDGRLYLAGDKLREVANVERRETTVPPEELRHGNRD